MNLTGITEYEEVLEKHFYDSLTMANKVNLNNSTLVDIGAGAGFPCIPLKIARIKFFSKYHAFYFYLIFS